MNLESLKQKKVNVKMISYLVIAGLIVFAGWQTSQLLCNWFVNYFQLGK